MVVPCMHLPQEVKSACAKEDVERSCSELECSIHLESILSKVDLECTFSPCCEEGLWTYIQPNRGSFSVSGFTAIDPTAISAANCCSTASSNSSPVTLSSESSSV